MPDEKNNEEVLMTGAEEERIYIIVPQTVDITVDDQTHRIPMVPGRLMAQCSHVGRKLEHQYITKMDREAFKEGLPAYAGMVYRTVTTIVLSVRNSKELVKVCDELYFTIPKQDRSRLFAEFYDVNEPLYCTKGEVRTAVAVGPIKKSLISDAIGHLDLYE